MHEATWSLQSEAVMWIEVTALGATATHELELAFVAWHFITGKTPHNMWGFMWGLCVHACACVRKWFLVCVGERVYYCVRVRARERESARARERESARAREREGERARESDRVRECE